MEALKLLLVVANAGRKYKELICESFGKLCGSLSLSLSLCLSLSVCLSVCHDHIFLRSN